MGAKIACIRCKCAALCLVEGKKKFTGKLGYCYMCVQLCYRMDLEALVGTGANRLVLTLGWHRVNVACMQADGLNGVSMGAMVQPQHICNECKQKQIEKEDQEIKKILTNRIS